MKNGKFVIPVDCSFKPKGFNSHQRACERRARESEEDAEQWASIPHVQAAAVPALSVQAAHGDAWIEQDYNHDHDNDHYNTDVDMSSDRSDSEPDIDVPGPAINDIRTEFHPHARIAPRIEVFTDFTRHHNYEPPHPEHQPWLPFSCQLDFEVAKLAHKATLTHEQTTCLIRLVQRSKSEVFTLKNYADVRNTWEAASHQLTLFEKDTVVVLLDGTDKEYTVYFRPLWDWVIDILRHPIIGPHCVFDAQQLSKFDGDTFIRFINEPWTADAFWDCQSQIPPDAKPLAFIFRKKGYPVIARLANLPIAIRNRSGMGGGRVVGWLPLVKEDPKYKGTPQFANFKVAVWHASIEKVLASIVPPSISGQWANCWDNIARLFYTLVLILSTDYEEQDELASIMPHNYALWTSQATNTLLIEARAEHCKGRQEAILKSQSIRDVDNAFHDMNLKTTHMHRALCYDRLHAVLRGLFRDHMWPELQLLIGLLGRNPTMKIDQNKYEDIFKSYVLSNQLITFMAHDVLPNADESKVAYLLLRCIRAYLDMNLYAALEVQTTTTIAGGREALEKFSELMNKYIEKSQAIRPDKNWSFPKNHLAAHLFDDIEAKGVTCNYNTKPNEKFVILFSISLVLVLIYGRVDELDAYNTQMAKDEDNENDPDTNVPSNFHIRFRSKQPKKSLEAIETQYINNPSFRRFCTKLNAFLNSLPAITQQARVNMLPLDELVSFLHGSSCSLHHNQEKLLYTLAGGPLIGSDDCVFVLHSFTSVWCNLASSLISVCLCVHVYAYFNMSASGVLHDRINTELGGVNSLPRLGALEKLTSAPFIVIGPGADVGYPAPGTVDQSSAASLIYLFDRYYAAHWQSRYEAMISVQHHIKRKIDKLHSLVYNHGKEEIKDITGKHCVCSGHHVRFFLKNRNKADKSRNCPAGFIADQGVDNPTVWMASHPVPGDKGGIN
ncbi:uncharacterized protein EDB91DRAFT_1083640 [Suillus paluster]|uniref:uncharacterized protein n=1 Tax=Suillus paluster TaxID=48578 RepID=UPI001B87FBB1|nr:uncharacterized protein EDB91DRAFT_1083640 [Suillus paluster]KAG1735740.1 hypothetical protein EDB91DRAFT_1083640 [Suillus paluster]